MRKKILILFVLTFWLGGGLAFSQEEEGGGGVLEGFGAELNGNLSFGNARTFFIPSFVPSIG